MTTKRVGIAVDTTAYGGAEFYVTQLLSHLPPRFEAVLLCTERTPPALFEFARQARVRAITMPTVCSKWDLTEMLRLERVLRHARVDLLHVNMIEPTNNRHVMTAAMLSRVPVVATLHSVDLEASALYRRMLAALLRRTRLLIAASSEIRDFLVIELGARPTKVRVVQNGVDVRPPVRRSAGAQVQLGVAGRLTTQKGFDVLIDALASPALRGAGVATMIWGDGPDRSSLAAAAAGLPVSLVGTDVDVRSFLDGLDIFCLPSRWEGLPFALLEAMMGGIACIATDVGDVREALDGCGIVVPPGDVTALAGAVATLVGDQAERERLGTAARERALSRYTGEAMAAAVADIYDAALGVGQARSG